MSKHNIGNFEAPTVEGLGKILSAQRCRAELARPSTFENRPRSQTPMRTAILKQIEYGLYRECSSFKIMFYLLQDVANKMAKIMGATGNTQH